MSSPLNTLTWHRPAELNGPWLEIEPGILWQRLLSLEFHPYYLLSQLILHSASSAAVASDGLLKWRRVSPLKGCRRDKITCFTHIHTYGQVTVATYHMATAPAPVGGVEGLSGSGVDFYCEGHGQSWFPWY